MWPEDEKTLQAMLFQLNHSDRPKVKGENGKTIVEGASFNLQSAARRWMAGKFLPISIFFNGVRPKQLFKANTSFSYLVNAAS